MIVKLRSIHDTEVRTLYGLLGYECTVVPATVSTCDCHLCEATRLLVRAMRRGFHPKEFATKYPEIVTFLDNALRTVHHRREALKWTPQENGVWKRDRYVLPKLTPPGEAVQWEAWATEYGEADDTFHKTETLATRLARAVTRCYFTNEPVGIDGDILTLPVYDNHAFAVSFKAGETGNTHKCVNCGESYAITHDIVNRRKLFDRKRNLVCELCSEQRYQCWDCGLFLAKGVACECEKFSAVYPWNHKPRFTFYLADKEKNTRSTLFTGVEIEVAVTDTIAYAALSKRASRHPEIYCVHDGSITKGDAEERPGFEMVSHPFTRAYWDETLQPIVEELLGDLKAGGGRAWIPESCGFHIHMTRRAFTDAQLFKVHHLLMRNPAWTMKIGQRKPNAWFEHYASLKKEGNSTGELIHKVQRMEKMPRDARYVGVNTVNKKSVELRFFRGSLSLAIIQKNLEFAWALHDWSKVATLTGLKPAKFEEWVMKKASRYPDLASFFDKPTLYKGD